jgi:hypothetical protein
MLFGLALIQIKHAKVEGDELPNSVPSGATGEYAP